MRRVRVAVMAVVLFSVAGWAAARLPEEALQRARMAESMLRDNQTTAAIEILEKLHADYPAESAVSLRLAQIHDIDGKDGPALFYYRKYVEAAGQSVRDEPLLRIQSLELKRSAVDAAEKFAAARKVQTRRAATPTPMVSVSTEQLNPDGSISKIQLPPDVQAALLRDDDDTTAIRLTGEVRVIPDEEPRGNEDAEEDTVLPRRTPGPIMTPPTRAEPQVPTPAAAPPAFAPPVIPGAANSPRPGAASSEVTPPPPPRRTPAAAAEASPAAGSFSADEFPRRQLEVAVSPPGATPAPARTGALPARTVSEPAAGQRTAPAAATAAPRAVKSDPFAQRLFQSRQRPGSNSVFKMSNAYDFAVVAFGAQPVAGGAAANAILAPSETREIEVPPGTYSIMITVTATTYPPGAPVDKRFDFVAEPGTEYSCAFSAESMQ